VFSRVNAFQCNPVTLAWTSPDVRNNAQSTLLLWKPTQPPVVVRFVTSSISADVQSRVSAIAWNGRSATERRPAGSPSIITSRSPTASTARIRIRCIASHAVDLDSWQVANESRSLIGTNLWKDTLKLMLLLLRALYAIQARRIQKVQTRQDHRHSAIDSATSSYATEPNRFAVSVGKLCCAK
jgi:hypothetical protein